MTSPFSADIACAFDSIAATYDDTFELSPATRHIRSVITQSLLRHFHEGDTIIDINCGTGTDAIALANHGIFVTAIDVSTKMVEIARSKSIKEGVEHMIHTRVMGFHNLSSAEESSYDGALSNFGGLNCTPELDTVIKDVSRILKPGSVFVACVMNRTCLWEILSFLTRGKFRNAFRRFPRNRVSTILGGHVVPTWYYSPSQFGKILSRWFRVERIYGVNIFSPSANSRDFVARHQMLTKNLLRIDAHVSGMFPLYNLGDHFVIEARSLKK